MAIAEWRKIGHLGGVHSELPNWPESSAFDVYIAGMRDCAILFVHLIVTLPRLAKPGGLRSVLADSVLIRHQLPILSRGASARPTFVPRRRRPDCRRTRASAVRHKTSSPHRFRVRVGIRLVHRFR